MLARTFQMKMDLDYFEVAKNAQQRKISILRCLFDYYIPIPAGDRNMDIDISEVKNNINIRYNPGIGRGNKLNMLDYL